MDDYESDFEECSRSSSICSSRSSSYTDTMRSSLASLSAEIKLRIGFDNTPVNTRPPSEASIKSANGGLNHKRNIAWLIENKTGRSNGSLNSSTSHAILEAEQHRKTSSRLLIQREDEQHFPRKTSGRLLSRRESKKQAILEVNSVGQSLRECLTSDTGSKTSLLSSSQILRVEDNRHENFDECYQRQVYPEGFLGPARLDYLHPLEYEYRPTSTYTNHSNASTPLPPPREDFQIFEDVTAQEYLNICGITWNRSKSACYSDIGVKERLRSQLAQLRINTKALQKRVTELESYTTNLERRNIDWLERYEQAWDSKNQGALQLLVAERELTKLYKSKHSKIWREEGKESTKGRRRLEASTPLPDDNLDPRSLNTVKTRSSRLTDTAFDKLTNYIRDPSDKKGRPTSPLKRDCNEWGAAKRDCNEWGAAKRNHVLYEELFDVDQLAKCKGDISKAKLNVDASKFGCGLEAPKIQRKKCIDIKAKFEQKTIVVRTAYKRQRNDELSESYPHQKKQKRSSDRILHHREMLQQSTLLARPQQSTLLARPQQPTLLLQPQQPFLPQPRPPSVPRSNKRSRKVIFASVELNTRSKKLAPYYLQ